MATHLSSVTKEVPKLSSFSVLHVVGPTVAIYLPGPTPSTGAKTPLVLNSLV